MFLIGFLRTDASSKKAVFYLRGKYVKYKTRASSERMIALELLKLGPNGGRSHLFQGLVGLQSINYVKLEQNGFRGAIFNAWPLIFHSSDRFYCNSGNNLNFQRRNPLNLWKVASCWSLFSKYGNLRVHCTTSHSKNLDNITSCSESSDKDLFVTCTSPVIKQTIFIPLKDKFHVNYPKNWLLKPSHCGILF